MALPRKTALLLSNLLRDDTLLCVAAHRLQAPHLVRVGLGPGFGVGFGLGLGLGLGLRLGLRFGFGSGQNWSYA